MSISKWLLDPTTPHRAVGNLVHRRWAQIQRGEYEVCLALRRLFGDNVHRHEGFSRFADYAEQRYGIPGKLADLFCFIAGHLARLPKTRAALECGDLTYTKAREFVRIATPDDEAKWIEYAMGHTNRDLERRCERARRGTDRDEKKVVSRLTPTQVQTTRKARETVMKDLGKPVREDQLLHVLSDLFVNSGGLFGNSGSPDESTTPTEDRRALPYLTINLCPQCTHAYVPVPGENLRVPVEDWFEALKAGAEVHDLVADLMCDCEGVKHRRDRCPHPAPEAPHPEAPKSRYIPAEVRRRIEARDGHRCRRPGCANPVPLEASHLKPYRDGTPPTPGNLVQHCATCNDLIETGRLKVEGSAPLEQYYLASGEYIGHGFDPAPHVGKRGRAQPRGDADPPGSSSDAA